ncbi:hypothetical protein GCM10023219_09810 [Stakelama sediminis]|uniref:Putative membrane protein n=1 Tax=Stakelama sediminis TaxID=463200 RepID=A0A840YVN6_9SPHN|nr:DUF2061 domain-containing protein [Stakelama sediminis]MBB5717703.1 putative membrane protein [Stakelama sediminis]
MFLFRGAESHPRSIVKAVSWRVLGSIDTFVLSFLFTHNPSAAGAIAGTEVFTKIVLFYFHERIWATVRWGHVTQRLPDESASEAEGDTGASTGSGISALEIDP